MAGRFPPCLGFPGSCIRPILWKQELQMSLRLCQDARRPLHVIYREIVRGAADAFHPGNLLSGTCPMTSPEYLICFLADRGASNRTLRAFQTVGEVVEKGYTLGVIHPLVSQAASATLALHHRIEIYTRNVRAPRLSMGRLAQSRAWPDALGIVHSACNQRIGGPRLLVRLRAVSSWESL